MRRGFFLFFFSRTFPHRFMKCHGCVCMNRAVSMRHRRRQQSWIVGLLWKTSLREYFFDCVAMLWHTDTGEHVTVRTECDCCKEFRLVLTPVPPVVTRGGLDWRAISATFLPAIWSVVLPGQACWVPLEQSGYLECCWPIQMTGPEESLLCPVKLLSWSVLYDKLSPNSIFLFLFSFWFCLVKDVYTSPRLSVPVC